MGTSLRDENKERTRQLIVEAAVSAFTELGYRSTSMSQIAGRAGVGRATLYKHFANKGAVADEIARSLNPGMVRVIRTLPDRSLDDSGIKEWVSELISTLRSFGAVAGVVSEAIGHNRDLSTALLESMHETSGDLLKELRLKHPAAAPIAQGGLAMLLTATVQVAATMFGPHSTNHDDRLTHDLAAIWVRALTR